MSLMQFILKKSGWRFDNRLPQLPEKCVICVAPHTSNWDFIWGEVATRSVGIKAQFLMKSTWFFFPLGYLFRSLGGIPVERKSHHNHVTDSVVETLNNCDSLAIAVTPEGTRSRNAHWHSGFLHIAHEAHVPVVLGYFDYKNRIVCLHDTLFTPSGDTQADMRLIKQFYSTHGSAKYPEKFTAEKLTFESS